MKHLNGASLSKAPALLANRKTRLKRLARKKHSSLLQKFVNYGQKKVYNMGPGAIFTTLNFLRNLQIGTIG
jgi:hypothetical protein